MLFDQIPKEIRLPMGQQQLQLEMEISPQALSVAAKELRETEETVPAAIAELKRLLAEDEALIVPQDDAFLMAALRPCHLYPESAAEKIKNYFRFLAKNQKIGHNLRPSILRYIMSSNIEIILPRRDQYGRRLMLLQTGKRWDPKKVPVEDIMRGAIMWLDVALSEPNTQVAGFSLLWDLEGLTMSQVMSFSPSFAKKLLYFLQDCMPMRLKTVHFVNQSSVFNIAFKIFKPFIKDKLRSRIFFHGKGTGSLSEHIDPDVLPTEYGGRMPMDLPTKEDMLRCCELFEDYFVELGKYGYVKDIK